MTAAPATPGWYPDPWYPGMVRWYDGATWTEHAAPVGGPAMGDPYDGDKGASAARWGAYAFLVRGALAGVSQVISAVLFARVWDEFFDAINDPENANRVGGFDFGALSIVSQLVGVLSYGCLVFLCIWTFRATTNARALGLRTQLSPAWTIGGWIIPLASLVMPWMAVRDLFPEGHGGRRRAGIWWGVEIAAVVTGFITFGVSIAGGAGPGVAVGLVGAALALTAGVLGYRIAHEAADVHAAIARPPS